MAKAGVGVERVAGIGDATVRLRTGRGWSEWFARLDASGAKAMEHRTIAAHLREREGVSVWWSQMLAVGYEQARGKRRVHQTPSGYQIGRSRTLAVSAAEAYRAFADRSARRRWLSEPLTVRRVTPQRALRISWADATSVEVYLYPRGPASCQVNVQHRKLASARAAARMKSFWGAALERLAASGVRRAAAGAVRRSRQAAPKGAARSRRDR